MVAIESKSRKPELPQTPLHHSPPVSSPHRPRNSQVKRSVLHRTFEADDFSKAYRFPHEYLVDEFSRDEPSKSSKKNGLVSVDDFLQLESSIQNLEEEENSEEPNDKTVPNFSKVVRIVREQLKDDSRALIGTLSQHKSEHFVLLLQRPLLQIKGIYLLKATMKRIGKIWGNGPQFIESTNIHSIWRYNVMTKQFEALQKRVFEPNTDAVSL
jgi:hypothetical protein